MARFHNCRAFPCFISLYLRDHFAEFDGSSGFNMACGPHWPDGLIDVGWLVVRTILRPSLSVPDAPLVMEAIPVGTVSMADGQVESQTDIDTSQLTCPARLFLVTTSVLF